MAQHRAGRISYALFLLALVEVLAWSLPLVHSATGGSTEDLQGYFSRETHITAELDTSYIHRSSLEAAAARDTELERYVGEEEVHLLDEQEKQKLAELTELMSFGFINNNYTVCEEFLPPPAIREPGTRWGPEVLKKF